MAEDQYGGRKMGLRVILSRVEGYTAPGILGEPFVFQAPPTDTFQVSYEFAHTDYTTLRLGELSRPGTLQLATVSFDTLFVDYDPWWSYRTLNPKAAAETLKGIVRQETPVRLTVTNPDRWTKPDVDMAATFRSIQISERAGEDDTRYVNVSFTEFRALGLVLGKAPTIAGETVLAVSDLQAGQQTISDISKVYYGTSSEWQTVRQANKFLDTVGNHTNLVEAFGSDETKRIRLPGARR